MKKPKIMEQSVSLKKTYRSVRMYDIEQVLDEKLSYDPVRNPETIANKLIGDKDRKHFLVLTPKTKHEVIGTHIAHVGQHNSPLMHPREIFKILIMCNAGAYDLAHNHPSCRKNRSQQGGRRGDGSEDRHWVLDGNHDTRSRHRQRIRFRRILITAKCHRIRA